MIALCCSIVGTTAILAGMLALLLAKGTEVFTALETKPHTLPSLYLAMILFGLLVQLLLAGSPKTKTVETTQEDQKKEKKP
jgi:hypothetical protein